MKKIALALAACGIHSAWASPSIDLDPLVISATRNERLLSDAPVRTEVVSREELNKTHARSLKEALENVPGLQLREIHGKSGYEASLQGMSSDQLLILVDGLPLAASTGSAVDLSQFAVLDIERIEIIKGAASAQYGSSAMGGVINIITRQAGAGLRGSVTYDAGSYGKQNISGKSFRAAQHHASGVLEGGSDTLTARLSADVRNTEGFTADRQQWARQGDDSERSQYALQLTWQPNASTYLKGEAQRFEEDDKQWLPEEYTLLPNKFETIKRHRFGLNGGHFFANGASASFTALSESYQSDSYKQNLGYVPFDQRDMQLDTQFLSTQLELPSDFLGLSRHELMVGVDLRQEELTQRKDGVAEIGSSGRADRQNYELFLQDDYFFSDKGELVLGLRVQEDSDFGLHSSPKAALKYRAFELDEQQVLLRASVGTGYRVPNLKERYYTFDHSSIGYMVMGDPNLKPEVSTSYQAGALWQINQRNALDVNLFYNDIRDLIQTDENNSTVVNGIAVYSYENISKAETYGIESVLSNQLSARVNSHFSHTYTKANNKTTGQPLTNKPEHIMRLGLDWQATERWDVAVRARYQSRELASSAQSFGTNNLQDADLSWSPAWATVDVKTSYQVSPLLRAFAGIDNLTNKQRDFSSGRDFGPIVGRFIYLGFEMKAEFL